eukprot:c34699_g1_i1 orf=363-2141(-)
MKMTAPKLFQSSTRPQTSQSRLYCLWLLVVIFPFAIIFFFFNISPNFQVKIGNVPLLSFESLNKVFENNPPVNEAPSKTDTLAGKQVYVTENSSLNTSSDDVNHHGSHGNIKGMAIDNKTAPDGNVNQRNSADGNDSKDKTQVNRQVDLKSADAGSANVNGTTRESTPMGTQGSEEFILRNSSALEADDSSRSQARIENPNNSSQQSYKPEKNGNLEFNQNVTSPSKNSRSTKNATSDIGKTPPKSQHTTGSSECDISKGLWVRDAQDPLSTNHSCPYIQEDQNCSKNERMDMGYWRWKPDGCELQRFDAAEFLKLVKGKTLAFVGDSIANNQGLSLLCLLIELETPTNIFTSKGGQSNSWHFPSSNFTLSLLWAPFLVKETENNMEGLPATVRKLHLDVLEKDWVTFLPNLDVVVLSTGQWFSKPAVHLVKAQVVGCYQCANTQPTNETDFHKAFRAAIRSTLRGITSLPGYRGITFFHTFTGNSDGGQICLRTKRHGDDTRLEPKEPNVEKMYTIRMAELRRAQRKEAPNGSGLTILDTALLEGGGQGMAEAMATPAAECWEGCSVTPTILHYAWNQILFFSLAHPPKFH